MRPYDVIIWGATGFTGRLVAEYFLNKYGIDGELKWAIAGRNQEKLLTIKKSLGDPDIDLITADSEDYTSLIAMTEQTRVICTTVGPYALYGDNLVKACIETQTDYCDLTGEVQWMRRIIDKYHLPAQSAGVRIVHTCGFDSIPSDMGVYYAQVELKKRTGQYAKHIKSRIRGAKGGMSGGTYDSLANVRAEAEADNSIYALLINPYGLNPDPKHKGDDKSDLQKHVYENDTKTWLAPFIMAVINTKVVRRSHALMNFPYGKDFCYDEAFMTGSGLSGKLKAKSISLMTSVLMNAKPGGFLQKITNKVMPKKGEGPTRKQREKGFFKINLYGIMYDGSMYTFNVSGDRDPGYGSTSKMLGESAACLALDKNITPPVAGVLTPSVAMGEALINRLQTHAGLRFVFRGKMN